MRPRLFWRSRADVLCALVCVGASLAVAACGSSDSSQDAPATQKASTEAQFPRKVASKLGVATVEKAPTRVVALGGPDADIALALGVVPVGLAKAFGPTPLYPWQTPLIRGKTPTTLDLSDGTPFEEVAQLKPDLILAGAAFTIEQDYATLSRFAPTIGYLHGVSRDTYQEQTRLAGKALGRDAEAARKLEEVDEKIAAVRREHPEFDGKTMSYAFMSAPNVINVVTSPKDPTVRLFNQLGVTVPERLSSLRKENETQSTLSLEQLDRLQADALVIAYLSPDLKRRLEANRVFRSLPVVKNGGYSEFDLATISALREPSVLSVPYGLERLTAALVKATS